MNGRRPGGWVALAVRYWRDDKILAVSIEAEMLWLHALCVVGEQESDGKLQRRMLKALCTKGRRSPGSLATELVRAGLWTETPEGYAFPFDTWSRWQETAEQKAEGRRKHAEKVARLRKRDRGTDQGSAEGSATPSGVGAGAGRSPTAPTAPDEDIGIGTDLWEVDDNWLARRRPRTGGGVA